MKKNIKNESYSLISYHALRNKNLSLKAKGLYAVLSSLPKNWVFSVAGLVAICKESKNTIYAILKELEGNGYIKRQQKNDGRFGNVEYEILSAPYPKNPYPKNSDTGNSTQLYNTINNKMLINNNIKKINKETSSLFDYIESLSFSSSLKNALVNFVEMRESIKAPLSKKSLSMIITKLNKLSDDEEEQVEILEKSIINCWKDVFPLAKNAKSAKVELKPLNDQKNHDEKNDDFDEEAYNKLLEKFKKKGVLEQDELH